MNDAYLILKFKSLFKSLKVSGKLDVPWILEQLAPVLWSPIWHWNFCRVLHVYDLITSLLLGVFDLKFIIEFTIYPLPSLLYILWFCWVFIVSATLCCTNYPLNSTRLRCMHYNLPCKLDQLLSARYALSQGFTWNFLITFWDSLMQQWIWEVLSAVNY